MKKIDGSPKSLKQLLLNTKYSIHYYQREYMWQPKHIEELIDDLTSVFLENYKPGDSREKVSEYGVYFMGSIVLAGRDNAIIDGQQRLSSLTLLLMYLNNRLKELGKSWSMIENMIFSEAFGKKSFNIHVEDRTECMQAIFDDRPFDDTDMNESVRNLYGRYGDIINCFPGDEINDEMLLHFCDWLTEKVFFIEIVASNDQDAQKVFVTMNDRGLSLTPTEMLKGYLLSEITDDARRKELNDLWKAEIIELRKADDKGDDVFIKAWLRSQYAQTIRETKAGAENLDFDIIGGPFHKWVLESKDMIGLRRSADYEDFISRFSKFAKIYRMIREAENTFSEDTKYIYYNARVNFTLQPQLLMAPLCYEDSRQTVMEKMNLTARYIDLYITARVTRYKAVDYSTIKNHIFNLTKAIRRCTVDELKARLRQQYASLEYDPAEALPGFGLNSFTKKYIKNMLARVTGYIEEQTGVASNYCNYVNIFTKNPFEIEHIITDHYEWFTEEYTDQEEFRRYRNSIGALLLLHKSINASLNDRRYEEKLPKYCSNEGNIYTESLGELAYKNNPRFLRFINENDLPFKPYPHFGKEEITGRVQLLIKLFRIIWNEDAFV